MPHLQLVGICLEAALAVLGLRLLWDRALSLAARSAPQPARLEAWPAGGAELLLFLIFAVGGGLAFPLAADFALRRTGVDVVARAVWDAAAFQAGLLAGIALYNARLVPVVARIWEHLGESFRTGAATFLICLPLVFGLALLWQSALEACGLPVHRQDVVELFERIHSPALRAVFVLAAIVVAPVTEELLFRAGLFRFLRGRVPRWVALLAPAVVFGASHLTRSLADGLAAFVPLVLLGVIFSLAYERTGKIGTTIIAHALFNLNTLVALLLGINP